VTAFVVNVPLSLVSRVQYAYQQVAQSSLWQAAGSVCALPLTLLAVAAEVPALAVVGAIVAGPLLVNVANSLWVYTRQLPELAPGLRGLDRRIVRELLDLSGLLLVLTVVMSVATNVDLLIITHLLDLGAVTAYAVPAKLFAQIGLVATLVNLPLWSANGEALARGQIGWVRHTTRRMTFVSGGAVTLVALSLVVTGEALLSRWLGTALGADRWLLVGLASWWVVLATISPRFMVQNAAGIIWPQLLGWSLFLVVSVPAKWYGAKLFGATAIPYVGTASYLLTVVPLAVYGFRRALSASAPSPLSADAEPTDMGRS
jgi:O-antigen/teichoic acid export membrane protein